MNEVQEIFSDNRIHESEVRFGAEKPLREFLLSTFRQFAEQEEGPKYERDSIAQQLFFLWLGKTLTDLDGNGVWEEIEMEEGEIYINVPIFGAFIRMLSKEYLKSRPSFTYTAKEGDVDGTALARLCNAVGDFYMGKWFNDEFEQGDVLQSFFFGDTMYTIEYREDMSQERKDMMDSAPAEDIGGGMQKLDTPGGGQAYTNGDLYFCGVDGFSWWSNSWAPNFAQTIWYREDVVLDWSVIKQLHPHALLTDGQTFSLDHRSLRQQRAVQRAQTGQQSGFFVGTFGRSGDLYERERIYTKECIKPSVYAHYVCNEDELLPDGTVLPKGTHLIDAYPNGLCVCRVGEELLDLYDYNYHKTRVHCRYQVVPNRLYGKSVNDAAELQYTLNDIMSVIVTYAMESSSPTILYDEAVVPDGIGAGGKASLRIPIGRRPPDVPLDDIIKIVQPGTMSGIVTALPQAMKEDLQVILGAFSPFGSGLPDAAGNTATGMVLSSEAAASQQAMALALRANAKALVLEYALAHFAEHVSDEKAFRIAGPYSEGEIVKLRGADLDHDIKVRVTKNSFWPREIFQQQQQIQGYYAAKTMALQTAMMEQRGKLYIEEERELAELWMIDIANNQAEVASEIAKERIDRANDFLTRAATGQAMSPEEQQAIMEAHEALVTEALQQAQMEAQMQMQIDPASGQPMTPQIDEEAIMNSITPDEIFVTAADMLVPMRVVLDPHDFIARYQKEIWALTARGRAASPQLEEWVSRRTKIHQQIADSDTAARMMGPQVAAQQIAQSVMPQAPPQGGPQQSTKPSGPTKQASPKMASNL